VSSFTTQLEVTPLPNGRDWKLLRPFVYYVGTEPSDDVISVPADFITDFASIPRALWWLYPPTGQWGKAAVIHDYLYRTPSHQCTRKEADLIFVEAMAVLDVPRHRRAIMYRALRAFGARNFKARARITD